MRTGNEKVRNSKLWGKALRSSAARAGFSSQQRKKGSRTLLIPTRDFKNEDGIRLHPQKQLCPQNLWEYSVLQLLVARGSAKKLHGASQNKLSLGKFLNPSPYSKAGFCHLHHSGERSPECCRLGMGLGARAWSLNTSSALRRRN